MIFNLIQVILKIEAEQLYGFKSDLSIYNPLR